MEITAQMVKELRERSGAGMMECKKALTQNNGDMDASIEWLRKQGLAKADKKADRVAAEGRIVLAQDAGKGVLVEINSETDFVAKDANFLGFADNVAKAALGVADVEALKSAAYASGGTVEEARAAVIAKVGENVQIRRMVRIDSANTVAGYLHGGRIGVLVELKGGSADLARGLAMHIAAMNPPHIAEKDVPAEFIAKEKEIYAAKAAESGKPANIVEKMVEGSLRNLEALDRRRHRLEAEQRYQQLLLHQLERVESDEAIARELVAAPLGDLAAGDASELSRVLSDPRLRADLVVQAGDELRRRIDQLRASQSDALSAVYDLEQDIEHAFNPFWGPLFKEGTENSRFGEQVEDYACLYTSRVSNFLAYSPFQYFRSPRDHLPHERVY